MNNIFSVSLFDISPPNLITDSNVKSIIHSLDPQLQSVSEESFSPLIVPNLNAQPDSVLDALAVQFHCDFYDLAGNSDMKKNAVSSSLSWHMKKGTPYAIIHALKALGIDAEFIPWWKFGGEPYTFRIKANITGDFYRGLGKDRITRLITRAVNESKSARSFMSHLDTFLKFSEFIYVHSGIASILCGNSQIKLITPDNLPHNVIYSACLTKFSQHHTVSIYRESEIFADTFTGHIRCEYLNQNIGVDLNIMMELLIRFEENIRKFFDISVKGLDDKFEKRFETLDAKIDTVIELLRWKGDDEEL